MTTSSPETSAEKYFDLHVIGLGYLNRIREVTPRKGAPFLACDIAALNGPVSAPEYCRFDVKVSGSDAQHLIRRCEQAVQAKRKVLLGFRLGDPWTDLFTYTKGEKAGQQGVSLKARLLFVSWIKIDGEMVYKADPKSLEKAPEEEAVAAQPPGADAEARAQAPVMAASF